MPLIIAAGVLQLILVVHAMKTGRGETWVWILLLVPVIGGLAYIVVEMLPEWLGSRRGRAARRGALRAVDPDRDLRRAVGELSKSDTVRNALEVAHHCLDRDDYEQALDVLQRKRTGVHEHDPDLLLGIARAQFGLGDSQAAIDTLDTLKAENPDYRSPVGHMVYARAKAAIGDIDAATHEYEALCGYYQGPEPFVRFADMLRAQGDSARARTLYFSVLEESERSGEHYARRHREWIDAARAGYEATKGAGVPAGDRP